MDQLVQVFCSLLILVAFAAVQQGALTAQSRWYLLLNLVGSTILTFLAAHERMWGFLMLEFFWALVSGWSLMQNIGAARRPRLRTRGAPTATPISALEASARRRARRGARRGRAGQGGGERDHDVRHCRRVGDSGSADPGQPVGDHAADLAPGVLLDEVRPGDGHLGLVAPGSTLKYSFGMPGVAASHSA